MHRFSLFTIWASRYLFRKSSYSPSTPTSSDLPIKRWGADSSPAFASFQAMILGSMVSVLFAWSCSFLLLAGRGFDNKSFPSRGPLSLFFFSQVLGFLSSWPPLAHPICYGFAPSKCTQDVGSLTMWSSVTISSLGIVWLQVSTEIDKCNVKIYLEKDWVSKTLEFAKRFFVSGVRVDCSPVSVRMWRSLVNPIVSPPFL